MAWEEPCLPACWSWAGREGQVGIFLVIQVCRWGEGEHWYPQVQKQKAEPRRLHFAVALLLAQCKYLVFSHFLPAPGLTAWLARFGCLWRHRKEQQLWQSSSTAKQHRSPFLHITLRSSSRLWDFRTSDMGYYKYITSDHKQYLFFFMGIPKTPKPHIKQLFISLRSI